MDRYFRKFPVSKHIVILKLIDYIERILQRYYNIVVSKLKSTIIRILVNKYPSLATWGRKRQVTVSVYKRYTKYVFDKAVNKVTGIDKLRLDLKNGELEPSNVQLGPITSPYVLYDGTSMTIGMMEARFSDLSLNKATKWAKEFDSMLEAFDNQRAIYDAASDTRNPKFLKYVDENLVEMEHWKRKLEFIKRASTSSIGSTAFICNGPPGVGKTTFVHALAKYLDRNVFMVDRIQGVPDLPTRSIVFFDDFDKVQRVKNVAELLSFFDGMTMDRSHVYILNTNDYTILEKRFPTLTRPGRTTLMKFDMPTRRDLERYRDRFCPGSSVEIKEDDTFATLFQRHVEMTHPIELFDT